MRGDRAGWLIADRHHFPVDAEHGGAMRRDVDEQRRRIAGEVAATAYNIRWQWVARGVEQLRAGIAKKRAVHVEVVGEVERADAVAGTGVDAIERQVETSGVATFARLWRRDDGQMVRVGFPPETLRIQPLLQTERTVDPRLKTACESRPVRRCEPYQQAICGALAHVAKLRVRV